MVIRQAPHYIDDARIISLNGSPGVLISHDGVLRAAIAFTVAHGRITEVNASYNPDKLRHLLR